MKWDFITMNFGEDTKKMTKPSLIVKQTKIIIKTLSKKYQIETHEYQDVIKALVMMISKDFEIRDIGYSWLQGLGLDEKDKKTFRFKRDQMPPKDIIKGISWIMSLKRPVILALDQLGDLLKTACLCIVKENPTDNVIAEVD